MSWSSPVMTVGVRRRSSSTLPSPTLNMTILNVKRETVLRNIDNNKMEPVTPMQWVEDM